MPQIYIDILTLFPQICNSVTKVSVIGRAIDKKIIDFECHQIRDFSANKHRKVDDAPFGGGFGMIMAAEPIFLAFEHICKYRKKRPHLIFMSPKGKILTQKIAEEKLKYENIAILCGRYEAVDERLLERIVDDQISIGDYVLSGGELPAMVFLDVILRMVPGVLSSEECFKDESHCNGGLEYPQYTRPRIWRGAEVPGVLLTGNHAKIESWKKDQIIKQTKKLRPDMIK
jgi:tRNA (guanine37-N1)-methyltransferase